MTEYTYYECQDCGWDSVRSRDDISGPCPLCAGDSGGDGRMTSRAATDEDVKIEGQDDRPQVVHMKSKGGVDLRKVVGPISTPT